MGDKDAIDGEGVDKPAASADRPEEISREEAIVREWFDRRIRNSLISTNVQAFNFMQDAIEDLVATLKKG